MRAVGRAVLVALAGGVLAGCGSTPTATFDGRLFDASGPLGRASVTLTRADRDDPHSAVTQASGLFTFPDVEHGAYELSVEYAIEDVYECELRYPVEIGDETASQVKRFTVPVVDIAPDGTARAPGVGRPECRELKSPLEALLCKARYPLVAFSLPSRNGLSGPGWGRLGLVRAKQCGEIDVRGRLPGRKRADGWLLVGLPGAPKKAGWVDVHVQRTSPKRMAWADVADAAFRKLPAQVPASPAGKLPDLEFTSPRLSHNVGEPCFSAGTVHVEWVMSVRNRGEGVAPKRFDVLLRDATGRQERRRLGEGRWLRGIAPGEAIAVGQSPPYRLGIVSYARLTIDPDNRVKESDESNNALTTGVVPNLICR